ncbi:MAG: hypothetical protein Athens101428_595 [Candidatus Berkelbacteria bacterium Athens1014_28]|uniref:Glycerophosphoryl diester phosphodiesterase membrane domain-containing protein n=1 Tax=Candidatus Berkelbacteria bacterium Athens1014_28 TaxID=2017145 RepID=A0A554LLH5_9BACT|nr:MAG: hypothetical protein Athens101428_595 [Candidatus Berkelbacteria bacterium Athens1014_28]
MNYDTAIKKSWSYILKYRFLWGLGVLAALTEGASGANFYSYSSADTPQIDQAKATEVARKTLDWISNHATFVITALIILFILSLISLFVSYCARAGLIFSIDKLESGGKINFTQAFKAGIKYFWRSLGLAFVYTFSILFCLVALMLLIFAIVMLAVGITPWLLIILIPIGIVALVGFIALLIYFNFILLFSLREIVIKNTGILKAIDNSCKLIRKKLGAIIISWLINLALGVAASMVVAIFALVIGGLLALIGVGIYFSLGVVATFVYAIPITLIFIAALILLSGIINAYFSTYWTLIYRQISDKT